MKLKREHLIILVIQITEVLGYSLIMPFLPFYAQSFGASAFTVGLILTSFSLFQFISAPIMGRLSDYYGRKPLLILSQLSTFLSFIVLGFSHALWMIFVSRIIDGLLGSNFTIAQAYLSDTSSKKERTQAFSISGIAFGLGFLIGPAIGGFLSQFSYNLPAFISAGITLITIALTTFLLPESNHHSKNVNQKIEIINLQAFSQYFKHKIISSRLIIFFTYILSHMIWTSSFALYANYQLGLGAVQVGYILAYIGLISIVLRAFLMPKLIKLFGESNLEVAGVVMLILSLGLNLIKFPIYIFMVLVTFYAIGSGLSRPLMMSSISKSVNQQEQGTAMGVASSLGSIAQIIGPFAGGLILNHLYPGFLGLASAVVMVYGLVIILKSRPAKT